MRQRGFEPLTTSCLSATNLERFVVVIRLAHSQTVLLAL